MFCRSSRQHISKTLEKGGGKSLTGRTETKTKKKETDHHNNSNYYYNYYYYYSCY